MGDPYGLPPPPHFGLTANLKKCRLGQTTVQYLCFCIGHVRISAILDKVATLQVSPLPATNKDLQQFLGLANYYRRFVPHFSARVGSLTNLLSRRAKGSQQLTWFSNA